VLDPDDRVMLFRVKDPRDGRYFWLTPGGGVNDGETLEDGARRELFEETGLRDVELSQALWQGRRRFLFQGREYDQDETFFLVRADAFVADVTGGEDYEQGMEHRWWRLEELEATEETVFPGGLSGLVRDILREGVPGEPSQIVG
jgi:ADP-ribose pyrophosphatase YjhB (NUDIX family)